MVVKNKVGYSTVRVKALWNPQENKKPVNYMGIEPWIIRNLINYKNCCVKENYYFKKQGVLAKIFGSVVYKPVDKGCCILEVTEDAVAKAKLLIY